MSQHHSKLTDAAKKTFVEKRPTTLNDADWESAIQWKMAEIADKKTFARKIDPAILASMNVQMPRK